MKREKKADLHHSLLTTKEKSKECLIVIRELNLSHSNQTEISTSIERKIERKLVEKHEKMRNLQENLNSERRLKETLSNDIQNLSEQIEKLKNELNDLKLLVSHDTEKIIDLEEKLKEQVSDSERIKETLNHIVEQKIQEIEVFNSSESLNMKLAGVRAEVHEAKKTNEILRKTLQEIKVLKANEEHPHRVSFENRSENLRKMIEQYICQDLELKELQIKLDTEISSKTCKCHIM
jgi:chromosome segregation ATPase